MRAPHLKFAWSFEREAKWMLWWFLLFPATLLGAAVVVPWIMRLIS